MSTEETMAAGAASQIAARPSAAPDPIEGRREILETLLGAWPLLGVLGLVGGAAGLIACRFLPPWFETTVQLALVPIDDPATPVPTNAVDGAGAELPLLVATLHSRHVGEEAVARFDLMRVYGAPTPEDARSELERHVTISPDKKANLVTLHVEDRAPWRARDLARYLGETGSNASASLWQRRTREHRLRLETRLAEVAATLSSTEEALRQFRDRHHVVQLEEQLKVSVAEGAALEHLKTQKRLGLHYAEGFGGADSSEVRRAQREALGVREVLSEVVHGDGGHLPLLALDELPAIEEESDRLRRAVAVSDAGYQLLARQVEQLRALETRPVGHADVVDPPSLPHHRVRPAPTVMAGEGAASGLLVGALVALLVSARRARRTLAKPAPRVREQTLHF